MRNAVLALLHPDQDQLKDWLACVINRNCLFVSSFKLRSCSPIFQIILLTENFPHNCVGLIRVFQRQPKWDGKKRPSRSPSSTTSWSLMHPGHASPHRQCIARSFSKLAHFSKGTASNSPAGTRDLIQMNVRNCDLDVFRTIEIDYNPCVNALECMQCVLRKTVGTWFSTESLSHISTRIN